MTSILTRFAERAVVGAYFLTVQLLTLYFLAGMHMDVVPYYLSNLSFAQQELQLNEPVSTLMTALITSIAVLMVVFFGTLLEVIGSVLWGLDILVFQSHLRSHVWFSSFMRDRLPEYRRYFGIVEEIKWYHLLAFSSEALRRYAAYTSCTAILITYVLSYAKDQNVRLVTEQMLIISMLQSLTAATAVPMFSSGIWYIFFVDDSESGIYFLFLALFVYTGGLHVATMAAYARFWHTMFSTLYLEYEVQHQGRREHLLVRPDVQQSSDP